MIAQKVQIMMVSKWIVARMVNAVSQVTMEKTVVKSPMLKWIAVRMVNAANPDTMGKTVVKSLMLRWIAVRMVNAVNPGMMATIVVTQIINHLNNYRMKRLFFIIVVIATAISSKAQFEKATLQATGLTCAMCSNAIHKALLEVPFIESVKSDIKNSAFNILFRKEKEISIDALREAVEDAGFSVGSLKMTGNFQDLKIKKDQHVVLGKDVFHFLDVRDQVLNGETTITVVDKNFLSARQFKKISSTSEMACVQTGKAEKSCLKEGVHADARVYHVTI